MDEPNLTTTILRNLVERGRTGDNLAYDELLRRAGTRLEQMAASMLKRFPGIRRRVESEDVLQGALVRLVRALKETSCVSTRHFYSLASELIRRELIDLTRYYRTRTDVLTTDLADGESSSGPASPEETDLDLWNSFHEAVARLPVAEREVLSLTFYHGWTQRQIAELLQINDREVRRRWTAGLATLRAELGDSLHQLLAAQANG